MCVTVYQEWEAFTGMIVSDVKADGRSVAEVPNWIEPDRAQALLLLKVWAHGIYTVNL